MQTTATVQLRAAQKLLLIPALTLLLLCTIPVTYPVQAQGFDSGQVKALIETSINLIRQRDFTGVALLYHYPPEYSQAALQLDLAGIADSLKVFAEDFGALQLVVPLDADQPYVDIFATSATHAYWDNHPDVHKVIMKTRFEHFGPGYIVFHFVDILASPEVKAIAFGLPESPQSVERIKQTGLRMMQLMEAQSLHVRD